MADESKPEVVAVRTGVSIDSRQKIPYFVGVSGSDHRRARLSLQYVIIPPAGAAVPHIHQGYRRPYTSCQDGWRQPMGQACARALLVVRVNSCTSRRTFHIKRAT